jgi:hypothetical protein
VIYEVCYLVIVGARESHGRWSRKCGPPLTVVSHCQQIQPQHNRDVIIPCGLPYHTLNAPSSALIRIIDSSSPALTIRGSSPVAISLYLFSSLSTAVGRLAGGEGSGLPVSEVNVTTLITVNTIAARMASGGVTNERFQVTGGCDVLDQTTH